MVTPKGIQTYVCFEKLHSGLTTKNLCIRLAISRIMEWLQGPVARMPWLGFQDMKG